MTSLVHKILLEYTKWWQTMKVCWSETFIYRVNFLLQVVGPAFVFLIIKVSLWISIYRNDYSSRIGEYTLGEMLIYHFWVMLVTLLTTSYNSTNLSEDIRLGRISSYLIYPFSLGAFHTAQFLAKQFIQILIVGITIIIVYCAISDLLPPLTIKVMFYGFTLCCAVSLFWFTVQYFIGLLSFWMEESWTLRVILHIVTQFLSGAIIPLSFYPEWLKSSLAYTPFPSISFIPIRVFLGIEKNILEPLILLLGWSFFMAIIAYAVWRKGLKLYTAAGM
jgi:ABC-2 type transport system permease protein